MVGVELHAGRTNGSLISAALHLPTCHDPVSLFLPGML